MITLVCLGHHFHYEMEQVTRLFFPGAKIRTMYELPEDVSGRIIVTELLNGQAAVRIAFGDFFCEESISTEDMALSADSESELERQMGILLYRQLQNHTGLTPPWGILTGVRPVRLVRRWQEEGASLEAVRKRFEREYLVQPYKVDLALQTALTQAPILENHSDREFSLYISIPFCPSRCLYCSFISQAVGSAQKLIPDYIRLLCKELQETALIARRLDLKLKTVYVGGGTPTVLAAAELERILAAVETCFDLSHSCEYTVEAGRPDTITAEKLQILKKFGVDRISINPQTMDDTILRGIGRMHTAQQMVASYDMAREMGFSNINMDLIAGLPGDDETSFARTLNAVLNMQPENLTLHTLTIKRSSTLREREDAYTGSDMALARLLTMAQQQLTSRGYQPYYLYRQKGTIQNLENTGYSLPGHESLYNVYSMEEMHTILAVGAGAIGKLCLGGHIQRICNYKYPFEYVERFSQLLERKSAVEVFYERYIGKEVYPG